MNAQRKCVRPAFGASRLLLIIVALAAGGAFLRAQSPQPPYALLERATLTASGNTMNVTQVPVVLASGIIVYVDLTMQFNVDITGNMTVAPGFPQVSRSPILLTGAFVAGKYTSSQRTSITIVGPSVMDGGSTQWTLSGVGCSGSGSWFVSPLSSSPLAARLKAAGITSTAWSYGIGSPCSATGFGAGSSPLFGVSQVGNTVTFVSFTDYSGRDQSLPQGQITFTLTP